MEKGVLKGKNRRRESRWVPGVGQVVKALPDLQHVFTGEQSLLRSSAHGLQLHLGIEQTAARGPRVKGAPKQRRRRLYTRPFLT